MLKMDTEMKDMSNSEEKESKHIPEQSLPENFPKTEPKDEDDDDDDDDEEEEDDDDDSGPPKSSYKSRKPRSLLTGRGVTIAMLIEDGIMEPGEKLLSIDYLGQKFQADLLPDGKIKWPEANKQFNSPSAWAIYCKRMVNPSKKSGCGWASVKYKGRKLDQYKTTWFKKQRTGSTEQSTPTIFSTTQSKASHLSSPDGTNQATPSTSTTSAMISPLTSPPAMTNQPIVPPKVAAHRGPGRPRINSPSRKAAGTRPPGRPRLKSPGGTTTHGIRKITSPSLTASSLALQNNQSPQVKTSPSSAPPLIKSPGPLMKSPTSLGNDLPVPLSSPPLSTGRKKYVRTRMSVRHSTVKADSDPHTLVELVDFMSTGKMQPFSVDISSNSLLLIDYHCHLTTSEVTGYLAGKWDPQTHHIKILQAFPCRCRFADKENAPKVEDEIRQAVGKRGLHLVGWYHSHPSYQADPSVQDIKSQIKYQTIAQEAFGGSHEPLIGMIVSPYDSYKPSKESTFRTFWVAHSSDPEHLGIPMHLNFTVQQDQFLTQDLLNELRWLCSFYKGSPDAIEFGNVWYGQQTYMDKVKHSLMKKFPSDQAGGRFMEFINTLLG